MLKLGILLSGRGSNFRAVVEAIGAGSLDAEVELVLSNKSDAGGLLIAHEFGIPSRVLSPKGLSAEDYDKQLAQILMECKVDLVVLAGYMKIVGKPLLDAFPGRIVNIHPSLLPKFKGLHAQKQALEAGETVSGCTTHWVDETLDGGPIIMQAQVPILPGDTEESLSARILIEEHKLLPQTLQKISQSFTESRV
jgi:phosphoribosylglycinamide formyltransferase-1